MTSVAPTATRARGRGPSASTARTTATPASSAIAGNAGSSQRPKKRSCVPMYTMKTSGHGNRNSALRTSSVKARTAPATAAASGTHPSPQVSTHR